MWKWKGACESKNVVQFGEVHDEMMSHGPRTEDALTLASVCPAPGNRAVQPTPHFTLCSNRR
jgi:hypothetical protein